MRAAIPLSLLAAAVVAGAATQAATAADKTEKPSRACFRPSDVQSWKMTNKQQGINLSVLHGGVYSAQVLGYCAGADFAQKIAIVSESSNFVCEGDQAKLVVRDVQGPESCQLLKFHKLTDDEVAGLSKADKP